MRAERALYCATLDLGGASVLVLGAGAVALRKLKGLPMGLRKIRVVAPRVSPKLRAWARRRPELELVLRGFRAPDISGCRLLFCCTGDADVNTRAAELARRRGVWVCQAGDPNQGDLLVPAVVRAGGLTLTLSTGGSSPALAKALRRRAQQVLRASDLGWLLAQLRLRRPAMKADPAAKARLLRRLTSSQGLALVLAPKSTGGRRRLEAFLKP